MGIFDNIPFAPIVFGTSGFRGKINTEVTPIHATMIAMAHADILAQESLRQRLRVAVAHDNRFGATTLARAASVGYESRGIDVTNLGCIPTGAFCLWLERKKCAGGMLVTGSHMPWERIGLIPMNGDGTYCDTDVTDCILERFKGAGDAFFSTKAHCLGRATRVDPDDVLDFYIRNMMHVLEDPHDGEDRPIAAAIREKNFNVLIDAGNGTVGAFARQLFEWLGCRVTALFEHPEPIPGRPSECSPQSCTLAIQHMKSGEFDIGFAFDGDADRVLMIDANGQSYTFDQIGALLGRHYLQRNETCVTPLNSSGLIRWACDKAGAEIVFCDVGQPSTFSAVKSHGAFYACEQSGKYGFPHELGPWYDALYASVRMLGGMAERSTGLDTLAQELPTLVQASQTIDMAGTTLEKRKQVCLAAADEFISKRKKALEGDPIVMNGTTRFNLKGGQFIVFRPSGTEELSRIQTEAQSADKAQELADSGARVVAMIMKSN